MACRGDDGSHITCAQQGGQGKPSVRAGPPVGVTCAEPPPERTATSACDPMMAMDLGAAGEDGDMGRGPDDGCGCRRRGVERKLPAGILQQRCALLNAAAAKSIAI